LTSTRAPRVHRQPRSNDLSELSGSCPFPAPPVLRSSFAHAVAAETVTQTVPLPLHTGRLHDFGNSLARIDVDRTGLQAIRRKPLQQILRHDDLSLAPGRISYVVHS